MKPDQNAYEIQQIIRLISHTGNRRDRFNNIDHRRNMIKAIGFFSTY